LRLGVNPSISEEKVIKLDGKSVTYQPGQAPVDVIKEQETTEPTVQNPNENENTPNQMDLIFQKAKE
jgi:hypothetical protein